MLRRTITTIRIPRPISNQETIPHQLRDFVVVTSTPEPIRFSTSLTEPTGGSEIAGEEAPEIFSNSPNTPLEASEEEDGRIVLDDAREDETDAREEDAVLEEDEAAAEETGGTITGTSDDWGAALEDGAVDSGSVRELTGASLWLETGSSTPDGPSVTAKTLVPVTKKPNISASNGVIIHFLLYMHNSSINHSPVPSAPKHKKPKQSTLYCDVSITKIITKSNRSRYL
ncbi:hypothetical protein [Clostridium minihomine]|uniref:hypothetical protein n=1 Tax=Clostridium minihomine TaxID=2045012 RepID=UPI00101ADE00|nr:hypothetical protein [Clostridium minihomine]